VQRRGGDKTDPNRATLLTPHLRRTTTDGTPAQAGKGSQRDRSGTQALEEHDQPGVAPLPSQARTLSLRGNGSWLAAEGWSRRSIIGHAKCLGTRRPLGCRWVTSVARSEDAETESFPAPGWPPKSLGRGPLRPLGYAHPRCAWDGLRRPLPSDFGRCFGPKIRRISSRKPLTASPALSSAQPVPLVI